MMKLEGVSQVKWIIFLYLYFKIIMIYEIDMNKNMFKM